MRPIVMIRTIIAAVVAFATVMAGLTGKAQAFTFGEGDLVLAIYDFGGVRESLYNLGQVNTRLANGASYTLDVSAGLTAVQEGMNPVRYTVFEWDVELPDGQVIGATPFSPSQIPGFPITLTNQFNPSVSLSFNTGFTFRSLLNPTGSGNLAGAWPVDMEGNLDQVLNLMQGDVAMNTFTQVGRVLLTNAGLMTIGNPGPAAVPLPAAGWLMLSGIAALGALARRRRTV